MKRFLCSTIVLMFCSVALADQLPVSTQLLVCPDDMVIESGNGTAQCKKPTLVCPPNMIVEYVTNTAQCRNPVCDAAPNLFGIAADLQRKLPDGMLKDKVGMPRPQGKTLDGKSWVGWTTGDFQCPPDILDFHQNPLWPCGFDYCPKIVPTVTTAPALSPATAGGTVKK